MMRNLFAIFFLALIFSPVSVGAFSLQTAPEIILNNDEILEENLYLLGGDIFFDKTFEEDVFFVSGKNLIKGAIFGDVFILGGESNLEGDFFGDTRILSGETKINSSSTDKDLIIVSGKVESNDNTVFNGQTFIVAGELNLRGQVLGDLKIIAGKVNVDAEILGDVEITAQNVSIGENSNINGNFVYFSPNRANINSGAQFDNRPIYNQIESIDENELFKKTVLSFINFWSVIKFLATLFTAFILVFVFRMFSQRTSSLAVKKMGKSILIGLVSIILMPIFTVILLASLFGIPVAGILFLVYLMLAILTAPVSGIILGHYIKKLIDKKKKIEIDFNSTALGIIILTFLYFIPFIGSILKAFFFVLSFGAMILYYFELITIKKQK